MKKFIKSAALVLGAALFFSCSNNQPKMVVKGDSAQMDTLSYCYGVNIAENFAREREFAQIDYDFDTMRKALERAALTGKEFVLNGDTVNVEKANQRLANFFNYELQSRMSQKNANSDSLDFDPETMFKDEQERCLISSSYGFLIGDGMAKGKLPIQLASLFDAWKEFGTEDAKMTSEECNAFATEYFTVKLPAENQAASEAWLKKMESKCGVKKTESGLVYKIVKKGNMDRKPVDIENTVEVHYKGSTRTGQVFDASRFADMPKERQEMMKQYRPEDYDKDEPVKFQLNRVIKGWGEGLQLIGEGGKIILWIPAELAYGSRGAGQDIGPNEALRFDVELVSVELPEVVEEAPVEAADSVVVAE